MTVNVSRLYFEFSPGFMDGAGFVAYISPGPTFGELSWCNVQVLILQLPTVLPERCTSVTVTRKITAAHKFVIFQEGLDSAKVLTW